MEIVGMREEYLTGCAQLYAEVFNAAPWYDRWTPDTARRRIGDIFYSPNFTGVVCLHGGRIQGAALGNYEQFYDGVNYSLKELFVCEEMRNRGIGGLLIRELEKRLKTLGATSVCLLTAKEKKLKKFYAENGYNEWNSMITMGKIL